MSNVQPFCVKEQIEPAKQYFLTKPERYKGQNIRDWCIFVLSINLPIRARDLLYMRMHNVLDQNKIIKKHILIENQRTGKLVKLIMTPTIQDALTLYLNSLDEICLSDPLFPSRQRNKTTGEKKIMTVKNLYAKLQKLKEELAIADPIGTYSLRITRHPPVKYIEQDEIDDTFMNNQL